MKRQTLLPVLVLMIIPSLLLSQKKDTKLNMAQALTQPTKIQSIVGLLGLDPHNFSMNHSYSLSFSSFAGKAYNQGIYLNTMRYQFSDKLSTYFQVGIRHQPFKGQASQLNGQSQIFVSGAGLKFEPMENVSLQFEFSQQPGYYGSTPYRSSLFQRENSIKSSAEPNEQ